MPAPWRGWSDGGVLNGNGDEDGGAYDGTELKNNASSAKPLSWLLSSSSDSDSDDSDDSDGEQPEVPKVPMKARVTHVELVRLIQSLREYAGVLDWRVWRMEGAAAEDALEKTKAKAKSGAIDPKRFYG